MKKIILSIVAVAILSINSFGQAPEGFKYQAVVRNASNTILINQAVGLRMTIKQGSIVGTTVYSESFASTTSANGLVNVEIGNGTPISGTFANIDWANGPFFIETAIDATGGSNYIVMGTSQLMSVPYALYAKTSGNGQGPAGPQGIQGPAGVDGINGTNGIDGAIGATGPQGATGLTGAQGIQGAQGAQGIQGLPGTNGAAGPQGIQGPAGVGIAQTLTQVGNTVTLSDGGGSINISDADYNPTNEIQTISRTGTTVILSNGGGTFEDSVGVYTAGEGVDITNNVITASHPAMQSFGSSSAIIPKFITQTLSLGNVSFMEAGYLAGPTSLTVINSGKYLINYDGTFEMQACGSGFFSDYRYRITVNGFSITSSEITGYLNGSCYPRESLSRSIFLVLNAGDVITTEVEIYCCEELRVINNNFSIVKL